MRSRLRFILSHRWLIPGVVAASIISAVAEPAAAQERRLDFPQRGFSPRLEMMHRVDHEPHSDRSLTPWIVTGAVIGGVAGAWWYASGVRDDGDFLFPVSVIVIVGGGTGLGGTVGFLIGWLTR